MSTIAQRRDRGAKLAFHVPRKLAEKVRIECIKRNISLEKLCTDAVQAYLDRLRTSPKEQTPDAA